MLRKVTKRRSGSNEEGKRASVTSKGSEEFFRSPSVVGQEIKKEEEEEEEEEDPRNMWLRLFLPDLSPLGGFFVIIVAVGASITYLKKIGAENPFIYPCFILTLDIFIYIIIMCIRHIITLYTLSKYGEGWFFAAVSGSLDPELVYCVWSTLCLVLTMGEMSTVVDASSGMEPIHTYSLKWFDNILPSLKIQKVPWDLIQFSHIAILIMTVRRLLLAVITFYFRLDFIMSINPQVSQFLRLYSLLRRIDTKLYLIKPHIQKKDFLLYSTGMEPPKKSSFPQVSDTKSPNRVTTGNIPNVPTMLLDSNIDYTAKSASENWLALQFIKQYNVSIYIDDDKYEIRTKQQARDFAKIIFYDILQHLHAIMLYHYIGGTDHVKPQTDPQLRSDTYSIIGDDTFCHALIDFEERHDVKHSDFKSEEFSSGESNCLESSNANDTQHSRGCNAPPKSAEEHNNDDSYSCTNNNSSNERSHTQNESKNKNQSLPTTLPNSVLEILYDKPLGDLIKQIDTARRGQITEEEWVRFCVGIYDSRKKILRAASSQEGIVQVFRRMISIFSWFFTGIVILLMVGINVNTLVISGAAIISSLSVGLSYIYSNFFSAVIFVIFLNPYNVGDRIRVNNGGAMIVKKIETFYTEFHTVFEAPVLIPHSWLSSQMIYNESRSKCCSSEIQFLISDTTSPFSIEALATAVQEYISVRPSEFVASNFWCGINAIQPGHSATVYMWITNTDPFHNRRKLLISKSKLLLFILHTLRQLGIQYTLPVSRVRIENDFNHFSNSN
ncbi:transmembrane domain-containing protein [Cryptosporidium canis]|uniref:Mechanosensitive ion channel protein n=1 Tax=Cryptosporidium canis TaxID=195482 RepID=A0ABQ8P9R6_9CRYT|nr:transmembrane domain-containing protein [Cryptosporidium canis]